MGDANGKGLSTSLDAGATPVWMLPLSASRIDLVRLVPVGEVAEDEGAVTVGVVGSDMGWGLFNVGG